MSSLSDNHSSTWVFQRAINKNKDKTKTIPSDSKKNDELWRIKMDSPENKQ